MAWEVYRVVFRLRSPMHIGWRKVGNIQLTRPYVTGRVLWGALTERLTRDKFQGRGPASNSKDYLDMGEQVKEHLAFTYFYPALKEKEDSYQIHWPWEDEDDFRACFLSSYVSTALVYPHHSAAEGTLHEIEFISPYTLTLEKESKHVFLLGYIFAEEDAPDWKSALSRLQFGGERGYGWGRAEPVEVKQIEWQECEKERFFKGFKLRSDDRPCLQVQVKEDVRLLAHALAADIGEHRAVSGVEGTVEPLVGRETREEGRFGVFLSQARICYAPGSRVKEGTEIKIGSYGIWEAA